MSHRTAPQTGTWGPASVITLMAVVILCALIAGVLAAFWIRGTYDVGALGHTLTLLLILTAVAVVICFMARKVRALVRSYRRQS
jgi:hypothetical protein